MVVSAKCSAYRDECLNSALFAGTPYQQCGMSNGFGELQELKQQLSDCEREFAYLPRQRSKSMSSFGEQSLIFSFNVIDWGRGSRCRDIDGYDRSALFAVYFVHRRVHILTFFFRSYIRVRSALQILTEHRY